MPDGKSAPAAPYMELSAGMIARARALAPLLRERAEVARALPRGSPLERQYSNLLDAASPARAGEDGTP